MKRILPILFLFFYIFSHAQSTIPTGPKNKNGKQPSSKIVPSQKPVKKIEYWDEAKKHKKSEEFTVDGKLQGKAVYYFQDGKIDRTGAYKNGMQDSAWTFYYKEGTKKAEEHYFEGKKSGPAMYWYKNGNKAQSGKFVEDLPDSTWTSYYETGKIKSIEQYQIEFKDFKWSTKKQGN